MSKVLPKLTIVIPSFGRHALILRQIKFLQNFDLHLIVVDGSSEPLNRESLIGSNMEKVRYIHQPGEMNIIERICLGLELVETKYFCMMDDSDLVIPESLSLIVDWLEDHNDYCAAGQVYRVIDHLGHIAVQNWGIWSSPLNLSSNDASSNLALSIRQQRTANLFYVVSPSRIVKEFVLNLRKLEENDAQSTLMGLEICVAALYLIELKFRKLDIPFWFRCDAKARNVNEEKTAKSSPIPKFLESRLESNIIRLYVSNGLPEYLVNKALRNCIDLKPEVSSNHFEATKRKLNFLQIKGIPRKALSFMLSKCSRNMILKAVRDQRTLDYVVLNRYPESDVADLLNKRNQKEREQMSIQISAGFAMWFLDSGVIY